MNQTTLSLIAGGVIFALSGSILMWWLTSRLSARRARILLRTLGLPLIVAAAAALSVLAADTQTTALPSTADMLIPSEMMTVAIGSLTETLNSTGALAANEEKTLIFSVTAPVSEVLVSAGDQVHAGDVLARIDSTTLDAKVRDAQIDLESAQASLTALQTPASDLEVQLAETSIQAAQASLSAASQTGSSDTDIQIAYYNEELSKNSLWQSQLNRDMNEANARPNEANAVANDIESAASLAQADISVAIQEASYENTVNNGPDASQLGSANAQLVSAQADLDNLLDGATASELRQAEIAVETAQLTLDAAEQARTEAELIAPYDGIVAAVDLSVGEMATIGGITLINTDPYIMTLSVDEKDITTVAVGQRVMLSIDSLESADVAGTITRVDPVPASTEDLVTYDVLVTLDPSDAALRPGMTAIANVILSQIDNVLVVPNRFITTDTATGQSTVKVVNGPGDFVDTPVTLGATTDSESIITSGLSEGQMIVILSSGVDGTMSGQSGGFGLLGGGPPEGGGGGFPGGGGGGGGFPGGGGGFPGGGGPGGG